MNSSDRTPTLKFCTDCGQRVAAYSYSTTTFDDVYEYGRTPESFVHKEGVATYRCDCFEGDHVAPNMLNTGMACPDCGHFMNMFARYCGVCSKSLRDDEHGDGEST